METLTEILIGVVLLPFFLLDALDHSEKKIKEDLQKMRTERTYQQKKSQEPSEHENNINK